MARRGVCVEEVQARSRSDSPRLGKPDPALLKAGALFTQLIDSAMLKGIDMLLKQGLDEEMIWTAFRSSLMTIQRCATAVEQAEESEPNRVMGNIK